MAKIPINSESGEAEAAASAPGNGNGGAAEEGANGGANGQGEAVAGGENGGGAAESGAAAEAQSEPANGQSDKANEYLDMLRRLKAEFDNYKRRVTREKADTISFATEGLVLKLLPVLDDLQRGIKFMQGSGVAADVLKGVELVERQLLDLLGDYNVTAFESVGQPFDPHCHDPLYTKETAEAEDNTVLEEERKGYRMHEKVLRPARVVVSRKPAEAGPGGD